MGLTIIFGMMQIVNFAHGELLLVGAYVGWSVMTGTGSFVLAMLAGIVVVSVLGAAMERVLLKRIYDEPVLAQLLLTFGIAELIRGSVQLIWGVEGRYLPKPEWLDGSLSLVLIDYPLYRIFVIAVASMCIIGTYLFLSRTDYGLIIRAGTEDRDMVNALGIDIERTYLLVFVFGAALAGLAGVLIAPIRSVYLFLGFDLLIISFVIVVVGGMGNFFGSIVAGLLIGLLVVGSGITIPQLGSAVVFIAMAVVLLIRPGGLFGSEVDI
jgi:branched-subunit amino acid ABC-type transport system permease component